VSAAVLRTERLDFRRRFDRLDRQRFGGDVWAVPIDQRKSPRPVLAESFNERDARVSSDGHWIAYVSDESGRPVVSVRSFSATPRRFVVSESGGDQPV